MLKDSDADWLISLLQFLPPRYSLAMPELAGLIDKAATWVFTYLVMGLLLLTGAFLTLRFGVVQLRRLPEAFRAMVAKQSAGTTGGVLSPFQAFMTALAASIGTGNIAG